MKIYKLNNTSKPIILYPDIQIKRIDYAFVINSDNHLNFILKSIDDYKDDNKHYEIK